MQKISKLESDESGTESRQRDAPSQPVKLSLFETLKKPRWATKKKNTHKRDIPLNPAWFHDGILILTYFYPY